MKSDFPVITRITEVLPSERSRGEIRLDVHTSEGQRFVWMTRTAARQLFEGLEQALHPADGASGAKEREPFRFRF